MLEIASVLPEERCRLLDPLRALNARGLHEEGVAQNAIENRLRTLAFAHAAPEGAQCVAPPLASGSFRVLATNFDKLRRLDGARSAPIWSLLLV